MGAIGYTTPTYLTAAAQLGITPSSPAPSPILQPFNPFNLPALPGPLPTPTSASGRDPGGCGDCVEQATGGAPAPVANVTQQLPPDLGAAREPGTPSATLAAAVAPGTALAAVSTWWWVVVLIVIAVAVYLAKR